MYQPYPGAAEMPAVQRPPAGGGLAAGQPGAAGLCTAMVWLAGFGAVVLLWRRSSRAFFNGRQP